MVKFLERTYSLNLKFSKINNIIMKKILLSFIALSFFLPFSAFAQENNVTLYFFWWDGCPHCEKEKQFFPSLQEKYGDKLVIQQFEIWKEAENRKLFQDVVKQLDSPVNSIPVTFIGTKPIIGYSDDSITGRQIDEAIENCLQSSCADLVAPILASRQYATKNKSAETVVIKDDFSNNTTEINIPFYWIIQLKSLSLPLITIILWALDWFNPCAMWILIFLISMLIGMADRRKMWIIWFTFIFVSALSYFLFMTAWLQVMLFLWFITLIRAGIGVFAILGWSWNLYSYWISRKDSGCTIVSNSKRKKISEQIKSIIYEKNLLLAIGWVIILSFSVNLIELLCSAGLPVIFTQMLALNDLNTLQHYAYILLYIFFFMLDDIIVFTVSMLTLQAFGITTKYTKYSHLIGWILMLIIWLLLLFRPELLMFG